MTTTPALDLPQTDSEKQATDQLQQTRMRRQLESIYGAERVWSWLEENVPLPAATVTTSKSVIFEARVDDIGIKRGKEGARARVVLVAKRKGVSLDALGDLSDEDTMLVTISPRLVQQPLLDYAASQNYSEVDTNQPGFELAPFEKGVNDKTLQMRLLTLGRSSLPAGWQTWPQDKKDHVAQWAWAIALSSDNPNIDIPEIDADVVEWFETPEATPNGNGGVSADDVADNWADAPPPQVTPENAEKLAAIAAEQGQPAAKKPKGKVKKGDDATAG